ncbi:MAG: hypothetical protein R8M45_08795 [Ghiorsea sp.]
MSTGLAEADSVINGLASMLAQAHSARDVLRTKTHAPSVNWVTISKFCESSGYSENAVHLKRRDGVWLEGKIWKKAKDGRILISLQDYELWVLQS